MKKLHDFIEVVCGKNSPILKIIPKLTLVAFFGILMMMLFTLLTLFSPLLGSLKKISLIFNNQPYSYYLKECDIFSGEWVPNPEAPYYTNTSCWAIHEHQNCMKYGRPDTAFMKWRWKPLDCELPIFNPFHFLEIMRGKSMAFVGDSVGRNQMQSLVCLLSRAEWPVDESEVQDDYFRRWKYPSYNFTIAAFWTTHLVKSKEADSIGPTQRGLFNLYLDEPDPKWAQKVQNFDYIMINAGQWFFRPMVFYEKQHNILGCYQCFTNSMTNLTIFYGYRKALKTAFKAINKLEKFKGMVILRTFAPGHFEGGDWNDGGKCNRTIPFRRNEVRLEGNSMELYMIQMEEFRVAAKAAKKKGLKYRVLDVTEAMLQRPDGHPSVYGHKKNERVSLYNDCVHWCLPGPVDAWSDMLLHMLKIEGVREVYQHGSHSGQ